MADNVSVPLPNLTGVGNVLAGLALAFGVDNILMNGTVTGFLPDPVVGFIGFVIFAGAAVYGYKQAKKLN
jgi:hypothetical protein